MSLRPSCRAALAASSDEDLGKLWPFSFGEHMISNASRSKTYRVMFFNHLIHHTAQLGVYLRLNEIPVPRAVWAVGGRAMGRRSK